MNEQVNGSCKVSEHVREHGDKHDVVQVFELKNRKQRVVTCERDDDLGCPTCQCLHRYLTQGDSTTYQGSVPPLVHVRRGKQYHPGLDLHCSREYPGRHTKNPTNHGDPTGVPGEDSSHLQRRELGDVVVLTASSRDHAGVLGKTNDDEHGP